MKIGIIDDYQSLNKPKNPTRTLEVQTDTFSVSLTDLYTGNLDIDFESLYQHYNPAYYSSMPYYVHIIDDYILIAFAPVLATEDYYAIMLEDYENYGDTLLILEWS
jgi:hypothetical protein